VTAAVRPRTVWKLLGLYFALLGLSALFANVALGKAARGAALAEHERLLTYSAAELRDAALFLVDGKRDPSALQELTAARDPADPLLRTVIAPDGSVLSDTRGTDERAGDEHAHEEVREALVQGRGQALRFSAAHGRRVLYVALPVQVGERTLAVARVGLSVADLEAQLERLSRAVWIGAALAAVFGIVAARYFARRMSRGLDRMAHAAEAIARGEYGAARPYAGSEELGRLASALDAMASDLRARVAAVEGDRNKVLAILGGMVEGVIAIDAEERVVHMNAVAGRLLRVVPSTAEGRRIWEVTRAVEVSQVLDSARRSGRELAGEVRLPAAPGAASGRLIELRASPLRAAGDELAGAVVVLHDVTDLRRLEAVRRDFVANVSHELKTPLTAIRGLVETLLDDSEMEPSVRSSFLERIRDQAARLATLVGDLLTLARIESQEQPGERVRIDLRGPLRECAARFGPLCAQKRIELTLRLPDERVEVWGDEESLRQILDNLADNAVKYTPSGGRVSLALERRAERVLIEVRDTGIGIEPRDQERIFERFYRVDKARSRELGGTGLGLSIVRHLALSLGGDIGLESQPGAGSCFRVALPAASAAPTPAAARTGSD
jgi:two-component system phosphate regulon sensor histidine kinase PhoR